MWRHLPRLLALIGILVLVRVPALGQGTIRFTTTLSGFQLNGGQKIPVRGNGTLSLIGSRLSYDITVPLGSLPPVEAHFHGPTVAGEIPIISLVPYQPFGSSIRYVGSNDFDSKWLPDIREGNWYINLHNPSYDNAIISGFIVPVVPEPGTIALLVSGFLLICGRALCGRGSRERETS